MGDWTRVRHPETGGDAIMPVDALPAQKARGWEPYGEPAADRMSLVIQRDTEDAAKTKAKAAAAAAAVQPAKDQRKTPVSPPKTTGPDTATTEGN